jgi:hypothetical protein
VTGVGGGDCANLLERGGGGVDRINRIIQDMQVGDSGFHGVEVPEYFSGFSLWFSVSLW